MTPMSNDSAEAKAFPKHQMLSQKLLLMASALYGRIDDWRQYFLEMSIRSLRFGFLEIMAT